MLRHKQASQNFKGTPIVHLYKRKENRQLCDNRRGTSLFSIVGKIFARILFNSLNGYLGHGLLLESQWDFRRNRETTDLMFAAWLLQEKCQEIQVHFYAIFVDPKNFVSSALLPDACRDERPGISVVYKSDGQLINARQMQTSTGTATTTARKPLFTDDSTSKDTAEAAMQRSMDLFAFGCANFGLAINTDRTVVI
nr:unnamed protein product [Spirometra erinaceieuropaei]